MADNFTALPPDNGAYLTRENLVAFGYQTTQNAQNGSITQPGIAFANAPGIGLYLHSDNTTVGLVNNGQEVLTFTQTGLTFQVAATGLTGAKETAATVSGPGSTYQLSFSSLGGTSVIIIPNAALTLGMNMASAQVGYRQVLHVTIMQPATGGFPVTLSMPTVRFPKNSQGIRTAPLISPNPGDDTPLTFVAIGDTGGSIAGFAGFGA